MYESRDWVVAPFSISQAGCLSEGVQLLIILSTRQLMHSND